MSVETTNTPNGASKDLYSKNNQEIDLNYVDMSAMDGKDLIKWEAPGDGIKVDETKTISVSSAIRDAGSVSIKVSLVGQPMIAGPEATSTIKDNMKAIMEQMLARKGVVSAKDYINYKKEKAEKTQDGPEVDENDRNADGIDDRNQ